MNGDYSRSGHFGAAPKRMRSLAKLGCVRRAAFLLQLGLFAAAAGMSGCSDHAMKLTGIWKTNCTDYWGVQIKPAEDGLYSVTFCGLTGCMEPGQWMPNTPIEGDEMYQVFSSTKLGIKRQDGGYFTYNRCAVNPRW